MRDGPEVGVHVWVWSDSVTGASRRLTPRMMREVGWRVAGKMGGDDSQAFIGTGQQPTSARAVADSQRRSWCFDQGTAYAPPSRGWVAQVAAATFSE